MQSFHLYRIISLGFAIAALSACGGGGQAKGYTQSSTYSSLSRASSSTSSSAVANCTSSKGDIFINAVCPAWRDVSIFEQYIPDQSIYREIRDSSGDLVTQRILDSGEAGHDQVLDIQYNFNSPLYGGAVRIFNLESDPSGVDMSEYATGKLVFDVKVISRGDQNAHLEVVLECGWPCNTPEYTIAVSELNQWQTFELPVKDFIADGLDIKHVYTGFFIQAPWLRQANAHFQIDNVRWVKGDPASQLEIPCFANHMGFNRWDDGNNTYFLRYNFFGDWFDTSSWLGRMVPDISLRPQWGLVSGAWGIAISEPVVRETGMPLQSPTLNDCIQRGTLSARVYLPASYVADGKMKVGLYISDIFGINTIVGEPLSSSAMTPDGWTTITVELNEYSDFDGAAAFSGVYFEPNGISAAVSGEIRVDNFVIRQKAGEQ